jgi:hypothetical protein
VTSLVAPKNLMFMLTPIPFNVDNIDIWFVDKVLMNS